MSAFRRVRLPRLINEVGVNRPRIRQIQHVVPARHALCLARSTEHDVVIESVSLGTLMRRRSGNSPRPKVKDDHRAAEPAHPPLPHRRNRRRELPGHPDRGQFEAAHPRPGKRANGEDDNGLD